MNRSATRKIERVVVSFLGVVALVLLICLAAWIYTLLPLATLVALCAAMFCLAWWTFYKAIGE